MTSLFKTMQTPDRSQTQLAYMVKFFPWAQLNAGCRKLVSWHKNTFLTKGVILQRCNDDKNKLTYNGHEYSIVWAHNNMPTEQEWDKKEDGYLVKVELRSSPVIPEFAVAVLSFEQPSLQGNH